MYDEFWIGVIAICGITFFTALGLSYLISKVLNGEDPPDK